MRMQLAGIGGGLALAARHVPCYDALVRMRADVGDVVRKKRKDAAKIFLNEQGWRNVHSRAQLAARGNATADAKWAREVVTCGWPRGSMVKRVVLAAEPDVALEPLGGAGQDADSIAFDYAGVSSAPTFASGRRRPRRSPASSARCLATTSRAPSTSTTARASCRIVTGRISSSRSRPW